MTFGQFLHNLWFLLINNRKGVRIAMTTFQLIITPILLYILFISELSRYFRIGEWNH